MSDDYSSEQIQDLLTFLEHSPTASHACQYLQEQLVQMNFIRLSEGERWDLQNGGRYFVVRPPSALIAFQFSGKLTPGTGARIVVTHLDSPALKLKPQGFRKNAGLSLVPVEVYGGPILSTWLDRPLGIAGVLPSQNESGYTCVKLPKAAVIPNAAIHLNRSINEKGATYNPQTELNAIVGDDALDSLAELLNIAPDILQDAELYLYDDTPATLLGTGKQRLLQGSRLDNLLSAYAAWQALHCTGIPLTVAYFADHEEIGSTTRQGANSNFLDTVLHRIQLCVHGTEEDYHISLAKSQMLSADAAHGTHPNYPQFCEPSTSPELFRGVAFKKNSQGRYATDANMLSSFRQAMRKANIPFQDFTNRADMPCGSTVGPRLSAQLGIPTIDLGVPMLAMHSIRETATVTDTLALLDTCNLFWNLE